MAGDWERAKRAFDNLANGAMSKPDSAARSVARSFRNAYGDEEVGALVAAVRTEIGKIEQTPGVTKVTVVQAQTPLVRKLIVMRAALDELTKPRATN